MEPNSLPSRRRRRSASNGPLRWATWAHSGPDVPKAEMPGFAPGTQKAVRGLSRVTSQSATTTTVQSSPRQREDFDVRALSTALFGSTPPSDDDSPIALSSSNVDSGISPPPSYTTIYPPSPPLSAASSPTGSDSEDEKRLVAPVAITHRHSILARLFPAKSPIHALPATNIALDDLVPSFKGVVVNDSARGTRTLYVVDSDKKGDTYASLDLRETICGVLERAEEELGCTGVVLALEKRTSELGALLHSLMYVGGVVVSGPLKHADDFILVGLDV